MYNEDILRDWKEVDNGGSCLSGGGTGAGKYKHDNTDGFPNEKELLAILRYESL